MPSIKGWEVCADAVAEMRAILDELEEYSGVYEETSALRRQLKRIEGACRRGLAEKEAPASRPVPGSEPRAAAQALIEGLPLEDIFENRALAEAFLSELLLALARAEYRETRRTRQREGIAEARAQGVRFGKPSRALPENFHEARQAWRSGRLTMQEAAQACGMAKTTFHDAVQRAEQAEAVTV